MTGLHGFAVCTFVALSPALFSNDQAFLGRSSVDPEAAGGSHAVFNWADYDGDGKLDFAAVSEQGRLQLLLNVGEGRFEDVTERARLAGIQTAELALWADYDQDGSLDLFVGVREGRSLLFRNHGTGPGATAFTEVGQTGALVCEGAVRSAHWLDHDGDGRLDLHVVTAEKGLLFQGREDGSFARAELPHDNGALAPFVGSHEKSPESAGVPPSAPDKDRSPRSVRSGDGGRSPGAQGVPVVPPVTSIDTDEPGPGVLICAATIRDQAASGSCIQASSTPMLGLLYPISANLFVAVSGEVGIGTTSPSATLEVAGTARVSDTLTLAPSGDTALDVSTGSIYKEGDLFIHTKGFNNTAVGRLALTSNTTGSRNVANGSYALFSNTSGTSNTAIGYKALFDNTTGFSNIAIGFGALANNTTGIDNTAVGPSALVSNTTGSLNTATGNAALQNNTTGTRNTAVGHFALLLNSTGNNNTACGEESLSSNTTGHFNTAFGSKALDNNMTGYRNMASGAQALEANTVGFRNTASGSEALPNNTSGSFNTACGNQTLYDNTIGSYNTACGRQALRHLTTGDLNIAIGNGALYNLQTGSNNIGIGGGSLLTNSDNIAIGSTGVGGDQGRIRIGTLGTHTATHIEGIFGKTVASASGVDVIIDNTSKLGTVLSSRRFKKDIRDMDDATQRLLDLRPVLFRYKEEEALPFGEEGPLEYGLIAEEVAEVFPDLVVYDEEGLPFTVKYRLLSSMLLNEMKKMHARDEEQARELEDLRSMVLALKTQVESKADTLASR